MEVAKAPVWPIVVVSNIIACSSAWSPATTAVAARMRAHMVGTGLGDALVAVRQVQWAAVCVCYKQTGIDAQ